MVVPRVRDSGMKRIKSLISCLRRHTHQREEKINNSVVVSIDRLKHAVMYNGALALDVRRSSTFAKLPDFLD